MTIPPLLLTNGMFIIDDIETQDGRKFRDVPGGAGTFTILGAQVVLSSLLQAHEQNNFIRWIVDRGVDFPQKLTSIIHSWNSGVVFRDCLLYTSRCV